MLNSSSELLQLKQRVFLHVQPQSLSQGLSSSECHFNKQILQNRFTRNRTFIMPWLHPYCNQTAGKYYRPLRSRTTPRTIKRTPKSQSPNAQQHRGKATCNVQARRRRPITKPSLPQPAFAPNYFPIDPTHTPAIYGPLATPGHSQHECTAGARCFCVFDLAPTGQVSDSRASKCRINCR